MPVVIEYRIVFTHLRSVQQSAGVSHILCRLHRTSFRVTQQPNGNVTVVPLDGDTRSYLVTPAGDMYRESRIGDPNRSLGSPQWVWFGQGGWEF